VSELAPLAAMFTETPARAPVDGATNGSERIVDQEE